MQHAQATPLAVLIVSLVWIGAGPIFSAEPPSSTYVLKGPVEIQLSASAQTLHIDKLLNRKTGFDWSAPGKPTGPRIRFAGDVVWQDSSVAGNHAQRVAGDCAAGTALFPVGERPVMQFNGDDYLVFADWNQLRLPRFSVHAVLEVKQRAGSQTFFSNYHNPINWGKGINLALAADRHVYFFTTAGSQESYDPMRSDSPVAEGYHVITCTYDDAQKSIFVDGQNIGQSKSAGLEYHEGTVPALGALREFENWFGGAIAEILIYDSVDRSQRRATESYLSRKYGLALRGAVEDAVSPSSTGAENVGKPVLWLKGDTAPEIDPSATDMTGFAAAADFQSTQIAQSETDRGGMRIATKWTRRDRLEVEWNVENLPDVPVVEVQSRLRNSGQTGLPNLREYGPLSLRLRDDAKTLKLHWVNRDAYEKREVVFDDFFFVSGGAWNSPNASGWLAIEDVERSEILFLGIEWESYWRIDVTREKGALVVNCALQGFSCEVDPGEELVAPRVFLGVSQGDIDDSLRDLHDYLRRYVITPPPADFPWVTYNTWGTEAGGIDEVRIIEEIDFARELGCDLFYVDASWYEGSCKVKNLGDWFTGVGNWHAEDFEKYPQGLAHISRKVHDAGMKFGLWFAPQMVDSTLVGNRIPAEWVARRAGKDLQTIVSPEWGELTQICLGNPAVVEFLKKSLSGAIDRYQLDWIKWDGSGLPGPACDRADHGHERGDGPVAAIRGQYEIWKYLHERYPDLSLEQCGYPCRIDYGLARYMRVNWLSDASSDPRTVRKNIINGSFIYPACHLETWVYKTVEINEEKDPAVLDSVIRSRMLGLFGFGSRLFSHHDVVSTYPPEAIAAARRGVRAYKTFRHLLREDVYHVLPANKDPQQWDAVQYCRRDASEAFVAVFRGLSEQAEQTVRLRGLNDDTIYAVRSFNTDETFFRKGSTLTADGVAVVLPTKETSEMLLIAAKSAGQ